MTAAESAELAESLAKPVPTCAACERPLADCKCVQFIDLPLGLHYDYHPSLYHRRTIGVASKGALEAVRYAPARYWAWVNGIIADTESKALEFGTVAHCFTLEPAAFAKNYVAEPDFGYCLKHDASGTTKEKGAENKKRRDDWRAAHKGCTLVTAKDLAIVRGMRDAIARDIETPDGVGHVFRALWEGRAGFHAEATLRWNCPNTGLICRARDDLYVEEWKDGPAEILDVKSCADCRPGPFNRARANFHYEAQDAMYRDGHANIGKPVQRFRFVALEKEAPFLMKSYELSANLIDLGRKHIESAKETLARCILLDHWPGMTPGTDVLDALPWELTAT